MIAYGLKYLPFCDIIYQNTRRGDGMDKRAYKEFEQELTQLSVKGLTEQAIDLLEKSLNKFPEKSASMNLDLAFLYLSTGNMGKSLEILNKALEKGIWYPKLYFSGYEKNEQFKKLFLEWDKIYKAEAKNSKPYWRVYTPEDYDGSRAYPLFVAIHGWGEDVDMFEDYWRSDAISREYILVLPQSSQKVGYFNYCWDDRDKAQKELEEMYKQVVDNYNVDISNIIAGGFSQGATLAIDLALNCGYMKLKGFVSLNPNKPEHFDSLSIEAAKAKGIKGYIITGDQDPGYQQQKDMMEAFKSIGFNCEIDVIEGWGHWFPDALGERIDKAIGYIGSL